MINILQCNVKFKLYLEIFYKLVELLFSYLLELLNFIVKIRCYVKFQRRKYFMYKILISGKICADNSKCQF